MSAYNYARMPGPGDLPGDPNHPNSPDYRDPDYDTADAQGDVAADLIEQDEVGALVSDVHEALALLSWVSKQDVPTHLQRDLAVLYRRAQSIDRAVEAQIEAHA